MAKSKKKKTTKKSKTSKRRQPRKVFKKGKIHITATFNNTLINITNMKGETILWSSTGRAGFKGSRKSTPFAATTAIEKVLSDARNQGLSEAQVYLKGPGPGRDAALRVVKNSGIKITLLADVTPIPHNGCRPKKQKRG